MELRIFILVIQGICSTLESSLVMMIKAWGREPGDINSIFSISTDSQCDISQVT